MKIELQKHDKYFDAVRYVLKAVKKTTGHNENPAMEMVQYANGKLAATNGRILNSAACANLGDEGIYEIAQNTQSRIILIKTEKEGLLYPKWDDIIPKHTQFFDYQTSFLPSLLYVFAINSICMNGELLEAAIPSKKGYYNTHRFFFGEYDRPVVIVSIDEEIETLSVVMPICTVDMPEIQTFAVDAQAIEAA
jgi:hypothetical protein